MHRDRIAKNCKFKVKVEPTSATFWLRFVQDKLRQKIAAIFDAEKLKSGHKDEFASFFSTPLFGVLKTILLQKKEFAAVMVAQLVEASLQRPLKEMQVRLSWVRILAAS